MYVYIVLVGFCSIDFFMAKCMILKVNLPDERNIACQLHIYSVEASTEWRKQKCCILPNEMKDE